MKLITDILGQIRKGRLVEMASLEMAKLVQAVDATNLPGKIQIELTVKPEKGGGSQKIISGKVTCKLPMEPIPEAMFFSDSEGDLHRQDPDQRNMFEEAPNIRDQQGGGIPSGMAKS